MATYEELKRRAKQQYEEEQKKKKQGETKKSSSGTSSYEALKERARREAIEEDAKKVDSSYIKSFLDSYKSFFGSAEEDYEKVGWGNASAAYKNRQALAQGMDYNRQVLQAWLKSNSSRLDGNTYKYLSGILGSYEKDRDSVLGAFSGAVDFYSQWDTEDEYNFWDDHKSVESRQQWYSDQESRLEKLKADRDAENARWSEVDPIMLGVESVEYQTAAYEHTQRLKAIDDEIKAIETEVRNYKRGNYNEDGQYYGSKVVDDYYQYSQRPDFDTVAANRDLDNPTREELTEYDALNDSSTWYYDENGVLRDAYGNKVEKDSSGKWINPKAQEYAVTDRLGIFLSASEKEREEYMGTIVSGTWGNIIGEGIDGSWDQLTENEIAIYYYLLNNSGQETADKYLSDMKTELNRRSTTAYNMNLAESFDEATFLEKIALNAASVPAQLLSGIASTAENISYAVRGQEINPYSAAHAGMHFSNTVRSETAEDFNAKNGGRIPILTDLTGFTKGDAYQAGMSILDSYAAIGIGGSFGGALLATNAASSEANRLYEQGASMKQIALGSAAAGAAEMVFESLSIEKLITMKDAKTVGQAIKNALIQAGVEASEEGFTEIANILTNSIIMGDQSDWARLVEKYGGGLGGMQQAFLEKVRDVANAAIGGFISGAGSAGGPSMVSGIANQVQQQVQYANTGKDINYAEGGVDALMALANEVAGVSEGKTQKTLNRAIASVSKNAGNTRVGKLYDAVNTANNIANASMNQADIAKSLQRKGFNAETAADIAEALVARYNGKTLTKAQAKLLESVDNSEVVKSAISSIMANPRSTMGQRSQKIRDFDKGISTGIVSRSLGMDTNVAKQAVEKQFTPEGTYETSVEDKSFRTDTGEVVEIKGIASIRNGEMILDIGDGNTINAKDVSYASKDQALIYEAVASLGDKVDAPTANKLIQQYKGGNAMVFARGMAQAYTYGFYGLDTSELMGKNSLATELTQEQRNYAYNLGNQYRNVKDQADKANARATKAAGSQGVYFRSKDGTVTDFRSYEKDSNIVLKDVQRTAIDVMERMSKIMGVRFNVFESWVENGKRYYLDENGVKTEGNPNGFYDPKTGEIYIDLAAGNDYQGTMLFTVAHELTHFMRQWSPEHFTKIARIVFKHGGMKGHVSELVAAKQAKAKAKGKHISYDTAMEEAVADGMETILKDGKVVEFMADVKKADHTAWEKIKEWFKNLAKLLKDVVSAYSVHSAQTAEGARVAAFAEDLLRQIEQIYAEGAVAAGENYQTAMENVVEKNAEAVPADEIITDGAVVTDGEGTKFSIKSMKHDIAEGQMFEDLKTYCGWTQKQVNELRNNLKDLVEYMTPFRDILDMNEAYGREGRRFSPYKPNSDPLYKISMDFSTLCSKRLLTQYVIENLQLRENRPMTAEEQMAIRDMLNEYRKVEKGLQVACAMCYVEAARLKSPQQIGKWLADPETQMRNYFADKDPEFAAYIKEKQADFKESRGYARNATKKDMSAKDVRELNKIRPRLRSQYQVSAEEAKIIARAKELPNSTYLTAGNLADLSESDPVIYSAYTAFVRTATRSKSLETDEPYYYGDSRRDNGNGIIVSDSFIEAVNRENGMRFSSWSDWRIQHLLDYITAVIDNSVRGAAMHGYTKFGEEVRVLGKTGMMFNMSGVAGTQTGLNEDGSLSFSPTESMDVDEAIQLREEFPETAGLQCIGVSDAHIIALLRSDIIDYIIPYHVSGLNAALRRMADIFGWSDYTTTQHAVIDKSIKLENAVDKEHWHEEPVWSEYFVGYNTGMTGIEAMRASADRYVQMCKDRGLKPKFEQFLKEENYWKLLIDRKMINQKTGKLIQQKAVTPTFDFGTIKEVVDRYVQNYDSGLEARALNHIVENWDSIPKRIKDLKKQGGTKAKKASKAVDTLANQTLAAQSVEAEVKNSLRDVKVPTRAELEKKAPIKVVDISTAQTTGRFADRRKEILRRAKNIIAKPYLNKDTKTLIFLTNDSYTHAFNNLGEIQLNAAEHLPELIENAVLTHSEAPTHGSEYTDRVYTFFAAARAKRIMPVKLKVKEYNYVGQLLPKNIQDYFDNYPGDYAASYDTVVLEVEEIEESPSGSARDNMKHGVDPGPEELLTIKVSELLNLVKGDYEKYIPKFSDRDNAPTFYSQMAKVVDGVEQSALSEGQPLYSERVTDKETLEFLENQEYITVYRAMQVIDGKLYPPMNAYTYDGNGKKVLMPPSEFDVWEQSTERPDLIDPKTGKFKLDKGKVDGGKKGTAVPAAYNPYIHTSLSMLNDQFTSAYQRSNLVVVKGVVPKSELTSGYRAQYAKDSVGETEWHSGVVSTQLPSSRKVILSRWFKPVEIVPNDVVAESIKDMLADTDIEIPYNVVSPGLRRALEKIGVPIGEGRGIRGLPPKNEVKYQDRADESVSNRSLLANALEGAAKNDIERNRLQEYKGKIDLINAEEQKLRQLNEQIKELSFAKGPKDTKAIRDLQFEARQTANRINTYDKMLLRLEASQPLQDVLTREKKMAYQRAEKKGKEALEAYREKTMKTQRELLDKWQESRKKGIDSRNRTAMRHKIKDIVNELNQYLLRGTKDRHVPIELQKAVAEALDAVNMDTVGAEERIAKLQDELLKAKTPEQIQEISRKIDHVREMGDRMNGRLQKLKDAYDQFVNSDDPMIANSHDEVISNKLQSVIDSIGNTPLRDMTLAQLEDVYDMYRMVLTTIQNANKAFKAKKNESISTIANRVMEEVDTVGGKKKQNLAIINGIKKFGWNNLKPVYAFAHIGSDTFTEVFNNVRAGEDVWAVDVTEAREFYLDKSKKHGYDSWNLKKRYQFTSTSGMVFELDLEQIMSLYAYSKRDQAADHLKKGGIVIDETTEITVKNKLGIPVKFNPTEATAYNISDETLAEIISNLTDEQKAFVDEMQDYLSTEMGAKGNEVSLAMYGIKLFKEKFYFPLKSAHQFMAKAKEQQKGEVKIKNSGFSKETVQKASNPIVLTPFMNVWADHVNEMSMYHAFVLPMEDFYRVYNYKTPTSETMATESVEMFIQNAYGKGATKYIDQLLKDLNGGARTDSTTGVINKMIGLFKKGAVFASLSVVVQQPSAIARAAALVDTKYFIGPKVDHKRHKALWNEVKQYAPVAVIKEMGYFDTNMGKSTQDFILAKEYSGFKEKMTALVKDSSFRDEALSKAPALADEIAWCAIWEAVKRETQAKNPGMNVKSEAFLKMVGERFTEVIVKTQVYDSVLSRSGLMRSKDTGMKMATAFMAEPTTSINMIADALLQGKRGDRKYCRHAIGAVIASQILNSILVSFVYAGRDDDEDETYWEKYIGTLTGEILDSLNPAGYIPFIKDIQSIVKGYDVERSDMAVISDLWNAIQNLKKDNVSVYRKVEGFAGSIAQIFGLPVKNIMRDARGIYQSIMSFVNGQQTTKAGIEYAVKSAVTGETVSNDQQLYEAIMSGDQTQIARVKSRFEDQSSINSAIRKALRENDPRIREAAIAWNANDLDEYMRLAKAIIAEKHFVQDDVVMAIRAEASALEPDTGTTSTSKAKGLFTVEKFVAAIAQGDEATANAAKIDIIQTAQTNGKSAEDAEDNFASSVKTEMKKQFLAGAITENQAIDTLIDFCGETQEEAENIIAEWNFEEEYGFSYSDRGDAYKSGAISADELREILVNVGGKTEVDAMWQVKVYDWQNEGFDIDSNQKSVVEDYETFCEPAGIDKQTYFNAYLFYEDSGEEGVAYSKTIECMPYINSLPLTSYQKTALAKCWWAESTVNKYKTW